MLTPGACIRVNTVFCMDFQVSQVSNDTLHNYMSPQNCGPLVKNIIAVGIRQNNLESIPYLKVKVSLQIVQLHNTQLYVSSEL